MIRAVSGLRYLQRGPGSKTLSSFGIQHLNDSRQKGIGNTTGSVYYSPPLARSFSSTTTNCQEEKSLSDATPAAPPSFDETMSKLFLESSEKVQAVGEVAAAAVWEPTWWPSDQIILLLNFIQETTGTPLAVTIIGTTISMRFLLFPLFVKSQRNQSRMAHMSPELNLLKAKVDAKGKSISQEDQIKMANQMKALFAKYEVNPAMGLMIPLVQMPIFMGMFFGLRNMPDIFPEEMKNGGMLWFADLTIPDPYYIMPILASTSFLLSIEANKEQMLATNIAQGELMLNVFRALGIIMIPSISFFSAGLNCYWVTNNTATLLQTLLFKNAGVRKYLGIWDPPKPVPGGPVVKGIFETAKEGVENLIEGKKKKSPKEEMEERNRAIDEKKYLSMIGTKSRENRRRQVKRASRAVPPKS